MAGHSMDDLLGELGPTGRYQIVQMIVSLVPTFAAAAQLLGNSFIAKKVPHSCAAPYNNTLPAWYDDYDNATYGECDVTFFDTGGNRSSLTEPCPFGREYSLGRGASAVSQFDLVCDADYLRGLSQTLVILGQGVGAVLTTIVSDKLGRKWVLMGANVGLFVAGMGIAFSPNYLCFAISKFIAGGFQQGILTGTFTYNAELFPTSHRHLNAVFCKIVWAVSTVTLGVMSWLCRDLSWRHTAAVYTCWIATLLLQIFCLDESIRWLFSNGKRDQAIAIARKAAVRNGADKEKIEEILAGIAAAEQQKAKLSVEMPASLSSCRERVCTAGMLGILRHPRLLVNALCIWFAWFTTALGYFAIFLNATSLGGDAYVNFLLTSLAEFPCTIYFYYFLNRAGRKITTAIPFMVLAVGILVQMGFQTLDAEAYQGVILAASLVAMTGASTCFGAVFAYTPELFPTNVRNQALGLSSFMGRIGGMLAPFTENLAAVAVWGPGVLIGFCAAGVCLLLQLLPETSGRELPQTVEDLLAWFSEEPPPKKNKKKSQNISGVSNSGFTGDNVEKYTVSERL